MPEHRKQGARTSRRQSQSEAIQDADERGPTFINMSAGTEFEAGTAAQFERFAVVGVFRGAQIFGGCFDPSAGVGQGVGKLATYRTAGRAGPRPKVDRKPQQFRRVIKRERFAGLLGCRGESEASLFRVTGALKINRQAFRVGVLGLFQHFRQRPIIAPQFIGGKPSRDRLADSIVVALDHVVRLWPRAAHESAVAEAHERSRVGAVEPNVGVAVSRKVADGWLRRGRFERVAGGSFDSIKCVGLSERRARDRNEFQQQPARAARVARAGTALHRVELGRMPSQSRRSSRLNGRAAQVRGRRTDCRPTRAIVSAH